MATFADVVSQEPEFAARVRAAFDARRHKYLATLRRDGSPRISGIEVEIDVEQVRIGSMLGAVKARDLQRDPRFALHSPTVDPPEDPTTWPGEAKLAGRVVDIDGRPDAHLWRLDLSEVVLTRIDAEGKGLEIVSWHEGSGTQLRRRS